jgi:hypothetical protein
MCALLQVKFILPQGPQPSLSIVRGGGLKSTGPAHDISVRSKGQYSLIKHTEFSYVGQRNLVECSHRGLCDYDTGMCQCFKGERHHTCRFLAFSYRVFSPFSRENHS